LKNYSSFSDIQLQLQEGLTVKEVVVHYLKNIRQYAHLNAFLEVFEEEALHRAEQIDLKIKQGTAGKLAGMVIANKDVINHKGHHTTSSSKILSGYESIYNATAIERLLRDDAIIIGRCNCDEFAMGSSNENSAFGICKNGLDETKVPGGSSGGSAVAVQMDMCTISLGSDTGGSIRQPASLCGVFGIKPTYGRVSRYGLIAYASSFDQIGVFSNHIEDAAIAMEVISGKDVMDATSSAHPVDAYTNQLAFSGTVRLASFAEALHHPKLDTEISATMNTLIKSLNEAGHTTTQVSFTELDYLVPTYYLLTTAEASSNLSRFDGIRYGYRSQNATDLESTYRKNRSEGFGTEVKRRIMLGTFVLSAGYYDAYYAKAQKMRRLIRDKTLELLKTNDFIILPTTPSTAFGIGEKTKDPVEMYLADLYTVQANITGLPAVSVPLGKHSNGLPYGIQLIGNKFSEARLLAFSKYLMTHYGNSK
jgi:aspartyl-tRNA(Asn)/glutamyl-tRNA(Gln) amidotransferase subunit A